MKFKKCNHCIYDDVINDRCKIEGIEKCQGTISSKRKYKGRVKQCEITRNMFGDKIETDFYFLSTGKNTGKVKRP